MPTTGKMELTIKINIPSGEVKFDNECFPCLTVRHGNGNQGILFRGIRLQFSQPAQAYWDARKGCPQGMKQIPRNSFIHLRH